jgi:hypothetical protein
MRYELSFMETAGLDGDVIQRYEFYSLTNSTTAAPSDTPSDASNVTVLEPRYPTLIYDVTRDTWHQVADSAFGTRWSEIYDLADWVEIFNNIV